MRDYIVLAREGEALDPMLALESKGAHIVETYRNLRAALVRTDDPSSLSAYGDVCEDFTVSVEDARLGEGGPEDGGGWNLEMVKAGKAHEAGYLGAGVKVAVVDTGADLSHEAFKGMKVHGYNVLDGSEDAADGHGHGTATAGIVASVAPGCELYAIKVFGPGSSDTTFSTTLKGIDKAMELGVDVINCSFGRYGKESAVEREVYRRVHDAGISVACSSGNYGTDHLWHYPSAYEWNLSTGSVDRSGKRSSFSSYGETTGLDVMAPGEDVALAKPGGGWRTGSGTSFSAPHVAGASALLKGKDRALGPDAIHARLEETASRPAAYNEHEYGAGVIDLEKALIG